MRPPATELSLQACLDRHCEVGGRSSLVVAASVDSTNRLARRIAEAHLEGERRLPRLVLVARQQTAGRGRRGRPWISPAGQGIYTSLLLPMAGARELNAFPLLVPLALCEALDGLGVACGIKWPNDLVVEGRKLGGVLIESLSGGRAVIVGYGVNGSQAETELPTAEATSLRLATGEAPDLSQLAIDLAEAVLGRLAEEMPIAALVAAYRERSIHRPGDRLRCRLGDELVSGSFAGFDSTGRLRLETRGGERVLGSAELLGESAAGVAAGGGEPAGAG